MKKLYVILLAAAATAVVLAIRGAEPVAAQAQFRPTGPPLELYERIPLPGLIGRIDHWSADGRLLLFSVVGSNAVGIENWFDGRLVHWFHGATEPQGVLYVPGFNKILQAGADGKVLVFDANTYALQNTIDFGTDADNLRWDAGNKKALVGFGEEDGGIAEIDPATNQRVGSVLKTGGHPESFQIETDGNMIFVNCPDAGNVVEAVNRTTGAVAKWPIHGAKGNFAMALNEADHRIYTVTRKPPYLIVFNTDTGKEVARVPGVAGECDDVYFDAARKRVYIIGGVGYITVVQEINPDQYAVIQNVPSTVGARTGYWYPQHDRLYVGVQAEGNLPAQLFGYEAEN